MRGLSKLASCLIAAALAWSVTAFAARADDTVVFNRGTAAEPTTLDPHQCDGNACGTPLNDMFIGLVTDDAEGKVTAGMAESWTVSPDGLLYTFTLREGIVWSDGVPITADDFVYSLRRSLDPKTASRNAAILYAIKNARAVNRGDLALDQLGVTAPDARTVAIALESPVPYFLDILLNTGASPVPKHVIDQHGRQWTKAGTMVTNGPYVLAEWVPQAYIKAVKNPRFYDAANVPIDVVNYYPTSDLGTSFMRFRAGELDVVLNFPPSQIDWIKENMPNELHTHPTLGLYYYIFNTHKTPFDNVDVRKALSIAVDRELIVERILKMGNSPAYGVVPPGVANYGKVYKPDYAKMSYEDRVEEARALLAKAGYDAAHPLKVTLRFNTQEEHNRIAVAMAGMWQALGVQTELANSDMTAVSNDAKTGNFELARYAWFAPYNDATTFLELLASDRGLLNFSGYKNPAYDAALTEAAGMLGMTERARVLEQAEAMAMEDFPVLPVYFYVGKRLVSTVVKGWIDNPRSVNPARYLHIERP